MFKIFSGDLAEITYVSLQETTLKLKAVVDDQSITKCLSVIVSDHHNALDILSFDKILITTMSTSENHLESLRKRNIPRDKIMLIQ